MDDALFGGGRCVICSWRWPSCTISSATRRRSSCVNCSASSRRPPRRAASRSSNCARRTAAVISSRPRERRPRSVSGASRTAFRGRSLTPAFIGVARIKNWGGQIRTSKTFLVLFIWFLKSSDYVFKTSIFKKLSVILYSVHWYMHMFILKS